MTEILAAGYVRVSSEEQSDGWSLEGQENQIRDYAQKNGYKIVKIYLDETSGSKEKRPGFDRLLMDAHNRQFQAIIVVATSRLFRNLALARRYKDLLRNKMNIEVIFVSQPNIDPNDPSAFIMEAMNELFDEYYLHQLRFWTTLGKQTRAQKGLWNGTLSFGYMTGEDGIPVPHPINAKGVILAFESYSTGRYSDREIAELLNREGYRTTGNWGERPFTKDTINRLLKNVFYLGYTKYKGELYPGRHEPIIDQELFDKCKKARAVRAGKPRSVGWKKRVYLFSGLIRCHVCQLTLRCYSSNNKSQRRYYRHIPKERGYECSAPNNKYLPADNLEQQWSEILSQIQLPVDWQQRVEALAGDAQEREAILKERAQVEERLRRLTQLYRDLLIEESEYRENRVVLQQKLAGLLLPENQEVMEAGNYLESLAPLWEIASLKEKREITTVMISNMYVDVKKETILSIEPVPAFAKVLKGVAANIGIEIVS